MTEDPNAVSVRAVSKAYVRHATPRERLKALFLPDRYRGEEFWALREVSLEVRRGETVGIVGLKGSGKSTLLQIIAGTLTPTSGTTEVRGRVSALLELGSGFNPDFTGRENVLFQASLLGLSKAEIQDRFPLDLVISQELQGEDFQRALRLGRDPVGDVGVDCWSMPAWAVPGTTTRIRRASAGRTSSGRSCTRTMRW